LEKFEELAEAALEVRAAAIKGRFGGRSGLILNLFWAGRE
jgi:hypothetical protein